MAKPIIYGLTLAFLYFSFNSFTYGANYMPLLQQKRVYGKSCVVLINIFRDEACLQEVMSAEVDFTQIDLVNGSGAPEQAIANNIPIKVTNSTQTE